MQTGASLFLPALIYPSAEEIDCLYAAYSNEVSQSEMSLALNPDKLLNYHGRGAIQCFTGRFTAFPLGH